MHSQFPWEHTAPATSQVHRTDIHVSITVLQGTHINPWIEKGKYRLFYTSTHKYTKSGHPFLVSNSQPMCCEVTTLTIRSLRSPYSDNFKKEYPFHKLTHALFNIVSLKSSVVLQNILTEYKESFKFIDQPCLVSLLL